MKMPHPCDTQNRKRRGKNPDLGRTNNEGRIFDDALASHTFVSQTTASQTWRVSDKVGQGCEKFRQLISAVLVEHPRPLRNRIVRSSGGG